MVNSLNQKIYKVVYTLYIMKTNSVIKIGLDEGDEVIERKVVEFGNSSHIILPKKYKGKKAMIIVTDEIRDENGDSIEVPE